MHELNKLRRRFVIILMCAVGLVLTVALLISVFGSFSSQYTRIQNSLSAALVLEGGESLRPHIGGGFEGDFTPGNEEPGEQQQSDDTLLLNDSTNKKEFKALISSRGTFDMVPVYVIDILFSTGEITIYGNATSMSDETLELALSRIETSEDSSGLFLDLSLFYQQETKPDGTTRIAFANASQIFDNTFSNALLALLVWVCALIVFFILSLLLSRMVLKPVELAWTKQREFIADASHELKTPLTIILANNNIVMAHPEKTTAEQQQWLESTHEEATRMNSLISDLLLLAQVEHSEDMVSDSSPADPDDAVETSQDASMRESSGIVPFSTINMSELTERALLQFDAVFFERHLSVESSIEKDLVLEGNQEHLRRLVTILLDNSSKYGNDGGTVTVSLARSPQKHDRALLLVTNTGEEIPPQKIDRVFDRFYRGDSSHSSETPGSGLGLALAQEIVHEHGGEISVTSKTLDASTLAQTTFTVELPLKEQD